MSKQPATQTSPIGPNTKLKLTLKWADVEPVYQTSLKKLAGRVKLDGFRKGKVPPQLAASAVGFEKVRDLVLDQLLPPAYQSAVLAAKKTPLTQPRISAIKLELNSDWELEAEIAEAPEIKLGEYKKVVKEAKKQAAKDLEEKLKADAKAAQEDKKSKSKTDETTQPAQEMSEDAKQEQIQRVVFSELVKAINPTIPELLVHQEARAELEQLIRTLDQFKISFDDYLARRQQTFDDVSAEMAATALSRLQLEFILSQIADDEKQMATEDEVEAEVSKIEDKDTQEKRRHDHQYHHYLHGMITRRKVVKFLQSL